MINPPLSLFNFLLLLELTIIGRRTIKCELYSNRSSLAHIPRATINEALFLMKGNGTDMFRETDYQRNLGEKMPRKSKDEKYCFPPEIEPSLLTHLPAQYRESDPISRIAFSSCMTPGKRSTINMWKHLRNTFKPDLWIWAGDNAYGDGHLIDKNTDGTDMRFRRFKYNEVREDEGYREYGPIGEPKIPVTGVWDDHDFGKNDLGMEYSCKKQSQKEFAIHFNIPETDPRHPDYPIAAQKQEGIYKSHMFPIPTPYQVGKDHGGVHVVNLDTRYFRHRFYKSGDPAQCFRFGGGGKNTDILGAVQWKWLERELLQRTSEIKLIVTSIQVLPPQNFEHGTSQYCAYDGDNGSFVRAMGELGEKVDPKLTKASWCREMWSDVPVARKRLLQLAQRSINRGRAKVVIFLSGDIHMGEIQAKRMPNRKSDVGEEESQILYEVTASGVGNSRNKTLINHNRVRLRTCDNEGDDDYVYECKFPFEWNDKIYHDCTTDGDRYEKGGRPWCQHHRSPEKWGYCIKEEDELVPMKNQVIKRISGCSENHHHVCNYKDIYGGIEVDWKKGKVKMTLYTPREQKKDGISSQIAISFKPEWTMPAGEASSSSNTAHDNENVNKLNSSLNSSSAVSLFHICITLIASVTAIILLILN